MVYVMDSYLSNTNITINARDALTVCKFYQETGTQAVLVANYIQAGLFMHFDDAGRLFVTNRLKCSSVHSPEHKDGV